MNLHTIVTIAGLTLLWVADVGMLGISALSAFTTGSPVVLFAACSGIGGLSIFFDTVRDIGGGD